MKKKIIQFTDTEKRHVNLQIRLNYDGIKRSEFFRAILTGYLERDEDIMNFIEAYKEKKEIHSIAKRKGTKKLIEKGRETEDEFGLNEKQIQNIFDIMEQEHPEL